MHTPTPITSICVSIYQDFWLSHPIAIFPLCRFIFFMIFDKCTSCFYWIWGKTSMPKQFFTSLIFKRSPKTVSTQKSCVFYKHIKINSLQTKGLQHKCRLVVWVLLVDINMRKNKKLFFYIWKMSIWTTWIFHLLWDFFEVIVNVYIHNRIFFMFQFSVPFSLLFR